MTEKSRRNENLPPVKSAKKSPTSRRFDLAVEIPWAWKGRNTGRNRAFRAEFQGGDTPVLPVKSDGLFIRRKDVSMR